jgi:transposase InsO family protein
MRTLTPIEAAWKLHLAGIPAEEIAGGLGVHRSTVFRWLRGIRRAGCCRAYLKRYAAAKKRERSKRLHPHAEALLLDRRRKTGHCGQKLVFWLRKAHGISVSVAQAYRILAKHFRLRSKWKKWTRRPDLPKAQRPRHVVQMDGIDFGGVWVHTFVDCFTREALAVAVPDRTAAEAASAARLARSFLGRVEWLQTDNGSEYGPSFDRAMAGWWESRRRIRPGQSRENAFVESFNRTVRKECLGWGRYRKEDLPAVQDRLNAFLDGYHAERPHLGLNLMTPNEYRQSHLT